MSALTVFALDRSLRGDRELWRRQLRALRRFSGPEAERIYAAIASALTKDQLDRLAKEMWGTYYPAGAISDDDASTLSEAIENRKQCWALPAHSDRQMTLPGLLPPAAKRRATRFPKARQRRAPDNEKSLNLRVGRAYRGSTVMPGHLIVALGGQPSHGAVMAVIKGEHQATGHCALSLKEIGDRAGVSRETAKRVVHKAAALHLISVEERPVPGRKHLPNVITIISMEWLAFLLGLRKQSRSVKDMAEPIGGQNRPTLPEDDRKTGEENRTIDPPAAAAAAQGGQPSKEAIALGSDLANISGYRGSDVPQAWRNIDPPRIAQTWIDLFTRANVPRPLDALRELATEVMRRKRKSDPRPPQSPRYFSAEVRKLADRTAPGRLRRAA
jgi:hypothetical protein